MIATAIYATIVADTGSFRFSNTTSDVLRLAADLDRPRRRPAADPPRRARELQRGQDPAARRDARRRRLRARRPARLVRRLAAAARRRRATEADAEGLVEYLRLGQGVHAGDPAGRGGRPRVKVSFRSEDGLDVNRLAATWGGGGHRHASGATLDGPLDEAAKQVVARARETLFPG